MIIDVTPVNNNLKKQIDINEENITFDLTGSSIIRLENVSFKGLIKKFFRKLLQLGSEVIKQATVGEIKQYFDDKIFKKKDVVDISADTTKEDELFDYIGQTKYYETSYYNELDDDNDKNKDNNFDFSL